MAGVFPFNSLPGRMNVLGKKINRGSTRLIRAVAKGIGATAVDTTRVDTGMARSNWRATLDSPATGVIPPYSPGNKLGIGETANAGAAKAQHKQVIEQFDASKNKSVFITNRTPYIGFLNDGSKTVAPGQMVEQGLQAGRVVLKSHKSLLDLAKDVR